MSNIFTLLGIDAADDDIDLYMMPIDTFYLFECRGDMHRVRSSKERDYYFYIDKMCRVLSKKMIFFDKILNPEGTFHNFLTHTQHGTDIVIVIKQDSCGR